MFSVFFHSVSGTRGVEVSGHGESDVSAVLGHGAV